MQDLNKKDYNEKNLSYLNLHLKRAQMVTRFTNTNDEDQAES
jgi:hypothetical protein